MSSLKSKQGKEAGVSAVLHDIEEAGGSRATVERDRADLKELGGSGPGVPVKDPPSLFVLS